MWVSTRRPLAEHTYNGLIEANLQAAIRPASELERDATDDELDPDVMSEEEWAEVWRSRFEYYEQP